MNKQKLNYLILMLWLPLMGQAQVNQYDNQGKRNGHWKVNFEGTSQTKFEGNFEHGKETGKFKFYKKGYSKHATAIMHFSRDNDSVQVTYYAQNGSPISEGYMLNKKRTGKWVYYHKDSPDIMMTEMYQNGKLEGEQCTYFKNGKPTEKTMYHNGEKNGKSLIYNDTGQMLQQLHYTDGELDGPATYYNLDGEKIIEGQYVKGRKKGTWKYYENGKLKEEKEY